MPDDKLNVRNARGGVAISPGPAVTYDNRPAAIDGDWKNTVSSKLQPRPMRRCGPVMEPRGELRRVNGEWKVLDNAAKPVGSVLGAGVQNGGPSGGAALLLLLT